MKEIYRNRFASYGLGIAAGIALLVNNLGAQTVNTNPGINITPNATFSYLTNSMGENIRMSPRLGVAYVAGNQIAGSDSSVSSTQFSNKTNIAYVNIAGTFENGATAGSNNYILFQDPSTFDYYYDQFTLSTTNAILDDVVDFGQDSSATASQAYAAIQAAPEPSTYALLGLGVLTLFIAYRRRVA